MRPPPASHARALSLLLASLALLAGVVFAATVFSPALRTLRHGFPSYYTAARLVLDGRWSPAVYDDAWFREQVLAHTGQRIAEIYAPNPPTTSQLLLPLAGLDLETARRLHLWLSLGMLGASLVLLFAALPALRRTALPAAALIFVLQYAPLHEDLRLAQMYGLLLFLFSLAFWAMQRQQPLPAGLALGLAASAKLSGAPLWLLLAAQRVWRLRSASGMSDTRSVPITLFTLSLAAATVLGLALLSLAYAGWQGWAAFAAMLASFGSPPGSWAVTAYQSTPSFFQHLFVRDLTWNPQPLLHLPWLALPLTVTAATVAVALSLWRIGRAPFDLVFGLGVTLNVVLLPLGEDHVYVLLLLPLAVALARLAGRPLRAWDAAWLALAALLLAGPWPFKHPSMSDGWRALLAYPRLYGGWLLWAWLWRETALSTAPALAPPATADAAEHPDDRPQVASLPDPVLGTEPAA